MGSPLAHENEAPYPEKLVEAFLLSYCPPGGIVLDPFCGSGTTMAVAQKHGRRWIGIDCRESQFNLSDRRIEEVSKYE
jgi:DNA modification methylase